MRALLGKEVEGRLGIALETFAERFVEGRVHGVSDPCSEHQLAGIKRLRIAAGRATFACAKLHQSHKCTLREPGTRALAAEMPQQVCDLAPGHRRRQCDEE